MSSQSPEGTTEERSVDDVKVLPMGRRAWSPATDATLVEAVDEQTMGDHIDWALVAEAMTRTFPRAGGWTSKQVRWAICQFLAVEELSRFMKAMMIFD